MAEHTREKQCSYDIIMFLLVISAVTLVCVSADGSLEYVSAVGDPGMRRDGLRLAIESWNQCNEVGDEAPLMGSPRAADCIDVYKASPHATVVHRATEQDNKLSFGDPVSGVPSWALNNVDLYAAAKELYLGHKCQVEDSPKPWHFWMIMLKSGNMDTMAAKCPKNGHKVGGFRPDGTFPCFGKGCMNQPLIYHAYTTVQGPNRNVMKGRFYGSWELDADVDNLRKGLMENISYHSVKWQKKIGEGGWIFHHVLRTSPKYPWLMLYLRSDATHGFSGGYHYPTRGMLKIIPESPNFKVKLTLNVIRGGGPKSQFYLIDIGSCWKNNGEPCNGDVTSDVTRYSEMIINPNITNWCSPGNLRACPLFHRFPNGTKVHRNDTSSFPYAAYHYHCFPGNANHLEEPYDLCDPYSNPQPQEILQILPHPVWREYGYPTKQGEGWIGDSRTWELDAGRLSQSLYFYQEPGTHSARRRWTSIDLGTEIYKDANQVAEWTVSDFDVLVPSE